MTISICMIVKNEEKVLARCLDSIADLAEEIIIVDTGSTDSTKEIAARYTDKIYDLEWVGDFSVARNFAFSKATMEYIYSADADEVLDEENRQRFKILKASLLPEIEIVQMKYGNQLENGSVYNFDEEYRPKLFKRNRNFTWIEPIHETVRLDPVVFDSDIVITHKPLENHAGRDLAIFRKSLEAGEVMSSRLWEMYAKELFISGTEEDIVAAGKYFRAYEKTVVETGLHKMVCCVCARAARYEKDASRFFKYALRLLVGQEECSEICYEMGKWYETAEDYEEALVWYFNAAKETMPVIQLTLGGVEPLDRMIELHEKLGNKEEADVCRRMKDELGR